MAELTLINIEEPPTTRTASKTTAVKTTAASALCVWRKRLLYSTPIRILGRDSSGERIVKLSAKLSHRFHKYEHVFKILTFKILPIDTDVVSWLNIWPGLAPGRGKLERGVALFIRYAV
jgi:hypothetical protein